MRLLIKNQSFNLSVCNQMASGAIKWKIIEQMFRISTGVEWWASIKWCYLIESSSWSNRQPIWIWMAFHCWAFSSPNRLNHLICYFLMFLIDSNDDAEWIKPENMLQTQYYLCLIVSFCLPTTPPPSLFLLDCAEHFLCSTISNKMQLNVWTIETVVFDSE